MTEKMNKPLDIVTPFKMYSPTNLDISGSFSTPGRKLGVEGDGSSPCLLPKVVQGAEEEPPKSENLIDKIDRMEAEIFKGRALPKLASINDRMDRMEAQTLKEQEQKRKEYRKEQEQYRKEQEQKRKEWDDKDAQALQLYNMIINLQSRFNALSHSVLPGV